MDQDYWEARQEVERAKEDLARAIRSRKKDREVTIQEARTKIGQLERSLSRHRALEETPGYLKVNSRTAAKRKKMNATSHVDT